MKTYPYGKDPAHPISFEIGHIFVPVRTIARLLKNVDGVTDVRHRKLFASWGDIRVRFKYFGRDYVVDEAYGDSDRYFFHPTFIKGDTTEHRDIAPIQSVFDNHATWPTAVFWIAIFLGFLALQHGTAS